MPKKKNASSLISELKRKVKVINGFVIKPELVHQSVWENGKNRIEPVSSGVDTAKKVFKDIKISVVQH